MDESTKDTRRTRGFGAIYEDPGHGWRGALVLVNPVTGRRERRYIRGKTKRIVERRIDKLRQEAAGGAYPATVTVGTYLERWLDQARPTVRPSTWREYRRHSRQYLIPGLGHVALAELVAGHVERVQDGLLARGLAPATVRHARAILRRALADAMRDGLVVRNAAALARPPKLIRHELRTLTAEEARQLIEATADDPFGPLYALAVTTGLRQGELLGLAWGDLADGALTVRRALARQEVGYALAEPKTARSRRTVMLPARAVAALAVERDRQRQRREAAGEVWQDTAGLIFTDAIGRPLAPSVVTHAFRKAADRLGFTGLRFHDLRHTAATLALAAGVGLKTVSDMLGHSTITLTADVYAHVTRDMRREAADALDRVLG